MANDQYTLLQNFQTLPSTPAGQNALQADLATVVSIYNSASVAQRAQAVQNSDNVVSSWNGNIDSFNPTAQYNIWQQISSTSQIRSTLDKFPQLKISSALAGILSEGLAKEVALASNAQPTSPTISAITQLLQGYMTSETSGYIGGSIAGVQMVGQLKDAFTAYSLYFPYGNPANTTSWSLPPCGSQPCQPDPRPYQLTNDISLWQAGQASASDMASQSDQWAGNQTSGAFPSGHSTYGNTTALLYAIMFPQAYQSLMVSGEQFGLSRNILGVHHALDIIGGRMLAYYTMTQLLSGNYTLKDVPNFAGVPDYTDFQTYVSQLSSLLSGQLNSISPTLTAVPYAACAPNVASCLSSGVIPTSARFAEANRAYEAQATYGLPSVGTTGLPGVVPANAELLLTTRFPYLTNAQIIEVLKTTELPSGGPLDDGTGWSRLNLFKAAGGYGSFDSNVSVTLNASLGGFNAVDMWSNDIKGTGGLTKKGTGLLILGGDNSYTGGTKVEQGTLALSGRMVGNLDISAGASFVSSGGYAVATGATLTNDGTFQSVDSSLVNDGTINNSGEILGGVTNNGVFNQTAGTFTNAAGSMFVNNATFTGNFANSGYLGGNGTFTGSVVNNGVVAPGNSIGTLNVSGSYTQSAGGTYQVEANASGQADRINVSGAPGTAALNGSVAVMPAAGVYAPSTTYTILNATGGITGSYSSVGTGLPFLQSSLAYDANNVYLTLKPGGFGTAGQTANQMAVGGALDRSVAGASGDFATVVGTMAGYTLPQGQAALAALSGENYSGFGTANLGGGLLFMNALGQQMALVRGGPGNGKDSRIALAEACDVACDGAPASKWSLWATAMGGTGTVAGTAGSASLTYNAGGAAAGFDYRFDPRFMAGLAVGFSSGNQWASGFSGQGTANAYQVSLYGSFTPGAFYVDAMAGYGYNDNQMTRQIVLPNLAGRVAQGRTGANQFLGQIEAGYRIGLYEPATVSVTPFARLQGTTVNQSGFTESGAGALSLTVAQQTTGSARSVLGAEFAGAFGVEGYEKLAMQLRLGWAHEYASTSRPVTASFAGASGSNFTVFGAAPQTDTAVLSLAADTKVAAGIGLYLRYDGEVGTGIASHALSGGFRATW